VRIYRFMFTNRPTQGCTIVKRNGVLVVDVIIGFVRWQ
jgi:hypothetical protein